MKKVLAATMLSMMLVAGNAQEKADTVIIPLAKTSQIIFTIKDRSDLEILKHYNFQNLFDDVISRLEASDTLKESDSDQEVVVKSGPEENWERLPDEESESKDNDDEWDQQVEHRRKRIGRTWQTTNVDLGINNYLADGQFPNNKEIYTVRPWGSWYVGVTSTQRTRVGRNFFLDWGLGVSWYNFKFENNNVMVGTNDDGVIFTTDTRDVDHIKSKLSATYLNLSFIPVLDFGDHGRRPRVWDGYGSEFRMGIGPYVGYRIGSRSKLVYKDAEDDREREKNRDNFYLNNLRYGARLQVGFRSTDFFINYDVNELFAEGKGPKLNAVSFGIIF